MCSKKRFLERLASRTLTHKSSRQLQTVCATPATPCRLFMGRRTLEEYWPRIVLTSSPPGLAGPAAHETFAILR